jgi:hypothetical protein
LDLQNQQGKQSAGWEGLQAAIVEHAHPLAMWLVQHRVLDAGTDRGSVYQQQVEDFQQAARLGILGAIEDYLTDPETRQEPFSGLVTDRVFDETRPIAMPPGISASPMGHKRTPERYGEIFIHSIKSSAVGPPSQR